MPDEENQRSISSLNYQELILPGTTIGIVSGRSAGSSAANTKQPVFRAQRAKQHCRRPCYRSC